MEVMVKLRGILAYDLGFSEKTVVLPEGSTTGELLAGLLADFEVDPEELSYTVDNAWRDEDYVLKHGDTLWLYAQTMIPGG
jgi:molybdopterin converting factor small subunit